MAAVSERLEGIASVIRGVSFDKSEVRLEPGDGMVPILRAGNISDVLDTSSDLVWVPSTRVKTDQRLCSGDIAICMSSGSPAIVGKSASLRGEWSGSVGAFCAIVRPKKELVDPDYLALYMRSEGFRAWTRTSEGVNIKNIRHSELLTHRVPVPPMAEQIRIVDLLSRADSIVRMRREAEQKAKEIIPARFMDMFGDPGTNPMSWEMSTLAGSGAQIRYGIGQPLPQIENGTPFLRATNVKRGRICRNGLVYIDPAANPSARNPPLCASDIIVVRSGAYTGDVAQVGDEFEGAIAGYDLVVRPANDQTPEFLATYLLLPQVQQAHIRGNTIRAAQPHLNAKQLGGIPVPLVLPRAQERFQRECRDARRLEESEAIATARAAQAFQSLLAGLFGERR